MFIKYSLLDSSKGIANVSHEKENEIVFDYPCESNHDCTPYVAEIQAGRYIFEVWGAQGGQNGGLGGFAKGTISLKNTTKAYIYIGGQGTMEDSLNRGKNGGYNGGGSGFGKYRDCSTAQPYESSGGGGATDIRLRQSSLNHRVIVAGGGGGINKRVPVYKDGIIEEDEIEFEYKGDGGGEQGNDGPPGDWFTSYGHGGNQTNPGLSEYQYKNEYIQAGFGYGGSINENTHLHTVGGGGGWFGGSVSIYYFECIRSLHSAPDSKRRFISMTRNPLLDNYPALAAGGGSGYVLSSTSHKPDYYTYSEDDYMSDTNLTNGLQEGNGKAKITLLELFKEKEEKYTKFPNYLFRNSLIKKNLILMLLKSLYVCLMKSDYSFIYSLSKLHLSISLLIIRNKTSS